MSSLPKCPQCSAEYTYEDGANYVCPECAHEWSQAAAEDGGEAEKVFKDANGNNCNRCQAADENEARGFSLVGANQFR